MIDDSLDTAWCAAPKNAKEVVELFLSFAEKKGMTLGGDIPSLIEDFLKHLEGEAP